MVIKLTLSLLILQYVSSANPVKPLKAIDAMFRGINLGNTFDAPDGETSWGNIKTQEYFFDDFVKAGFTSVRIPITWDKHTSWEPPFLIDSSFMDRIEQVVNWGLNKGMWIIINSHHDQWVKLNPTENSFNRFKSIWQQISERFQKHSSRLVFEILNEPYPMNLTDVDRINSLILSVIRITNPTRLVAYAGDQWGNSWELQKAAIPTNNGNKDDYLLGNYHEYTPWEYVNSKDPNLTWGTDKEREFIYTMFDNVAKFYKDTWIGYMINEFGCGGHHDYDSRMIFYQTYIDNAIRTRTAFFAWDDGAEFKFYDRKNRVWLGEVKDCLTSDAFSERGHRAICWNQMKGVQRIETKDDSLNGGKNVYKINKDDWMMYMINAPKSGEYMVEYRVAAETAGGVLRLQNEEGDYLFGTIKVPNTFGKQYWTTINHKVILNSGPQFVKIYAEVGDWSLNWFKMKPLA